MNRGRRRGGGGSSGLSGLRDGVKKRLFDPHSVPTKPDAKFSMSRLVPLSFTKASSFLTNQSNFGEFSNVNTDSVRNDLFHVVGVVNHAFAYGSSCPPPSLKSDKRGGGGGGDDQLTTYLHLLLDCDEVERWSQSNRLFGTSEPVDWYPQELASFMMVSNQAKSSERSKRSTKFKRRIINDIDEIVTDQVIRKVTEVDPQNDELVDNQDNDDDTDSEDARWNGEVVGEDYENVDEEEFDNDYCQAYFDNGEQDLSDVGEDDDGARYDD